jgi:hypothetical protein
MGGLTVGDLAEAYRCTECGDLPTWALQHARTVVERQELLEERRAAALRLAGAE